MTASKRAQAALQRVRERLRQPVIRRPNRRKLPGTSVRALLLIVTPVMVMTTLAVLVFVLVLNTASSTERLDLIRTALAVGAGTGAVMTLVLAWRRQWATEHDAAERRLTELYVKAVEQLGSDKAAVRHGALYALERVAQDNPEHRQTVVNVICAYLRAPYTPPPDKPGVRGRGIGGSLRATPARRVAAAEAAARRVAAAPSAATVRDEDRRQEREVRLTAQRILTRHLHPGDSPRRPVDSFWADLDLDLTGAHLINFDLAGCRPRRTQFSDVSFSGTASFEGATFAGEALFNGATFTGYSRFNDATFTENAGFDNVTFTSASSFVGVTFTRYAQFTDTTFNWESSFVGATFTDHAFFGNARFTKDVRFNDATFAKDASLTNTAFSEIAWFTNATFGDALFNGAIFTGNASFNGTTFTKDISFFSATFTGDAWFNSTTFTGRTWFDETTFAGDSWFDHATFSGDTWLSDARFAVPPVMSSATMQGGNQEQLADRAWPLGWTQHELLVDGGALQRRFVPVPVVLEDDR